MRKNILKIISLFFKNCLLKLIYFYKKGISPYLPCACRFQPTCSEYMIEAIQRHGIVRGLYLGIRRILRCNPWGGSGYDPVPPKITNKKNKAKVKKF